MLRNIPGVLRKVRDLTLEVKLIVCCLYESIHCKKLHFVPKRWSSRNLSGLLISMLWVNVISYQFKVVLGGYPRFQDSHDLSECHHLYDSITYRAVETALSTQKAVTTFLIKYWIFFSGIFCYPYWVKNWVTAGKVRHRPQCLQNIFFEKGIMPH